MGLYLPANAVSKGFNLCPLCYGNGCSHCKGRGEVPNRQKIALAGVASVEFIGGWCFLAQPLCVAGRVHWSVAGRVHWRHLLLHPRARPDAVPTTYEHRPYPQNSRVRPALAAPSTLSTSPRPRQGDMRAARQASGNLPSTSCGGWQQATVSLRIQRFPPGEG